MDQRKIGALLKVLRKEKELTQEQLAERFGVSGRTVSRWETGSNLPDISLLVELADFYQVDIRELIDGERKQENMNQEHKLVAQKLAHYAEAEKGRLLRRVEIINLVGLLALSAALLLAASGLPEQAPVYMTAEGIAFGLTFGAILTTLLYATGLLARIREKARGKRRMKILAAACAVVVLACLVCAAVASFVA